MNINFQESLNLQHDRSVASIAPHFRHYLIKIKTLNPRISSMWVLYELNAQGNSMLHLWSMPTRAWALTHCNLHLHQQELFCSAPFYAEVRWYQVLLRITSVIHRLSLHVSQAHCSFKEKQDPTGYCSFYRNFLLVYGSDQCWNELLQVLSKLTLFFSSGITKDKISGLVKTDRRGWTTAKSRVFLLTGIKTVWSILREQG